MTCDTAPLISSPVQPQETTICVALELSRSVRHPAHARCPRADARPDQGGRIRAGVRPSAAPAMPVRLHLLQTLAGIVTGRLKVDHALGGQKGLDPVDVLGPFLDQALAFPRAPPGILGLNRGPSHKHGAHRAARPARCASGDRDRGHRSWPAGGGETPRSRRDRRPGSGSRPLPADGGSRSRPDRPPGSPRAAGHCHGNLAGAQRP